MIIPIGHDDSWTKRRPLATWSIALICLAAWIGSLVAVSDMDRIPQAQFQEEARAFWEKHPYLEIEGRLARYMILREDPEALSVGSDFTKEQWDLWVANKRLRAATAHRASHDAGDQPEDLSNLQDELDELVGLGFYADPEQLPLEGEHPAWTWGLTPAKSTWYTYVTHVFMHGSWGHLLGNLFLFLIAAPALEDRWGRALFAGFFVATGVAAGGFHALMELGSEVPLVGASGAISAVLGAFLVLQFSTKIKFFWFFFPPFYGTVRAPAWICLPYWFLNEVSSAFMSQANLIQDNVAYWAHVGGFLAGSLVAVTVKGFRLEERFLKEAIRKKMAKAGRADQLARARSLIEGNLLTDAQVVLEQAIADHPDDPETLALVVEFAQASGRVEDAEPHVEAWLKSALADKPDRATLATWCRLVEIEPALAVAPATLFKLATVLAPRGQREEAAHALRLALSDVHDTEVPGSMLRRIADLAPRLPDAGDIRRRALARLSEDDQLPEERRDAVRAQLEGLTGPDYCDPFAERLGRAASVSSGTRAHSGLTAPIEIDLDEGPLPIPTTPTAAPPPPLAIDIEGADGPVERDPSVFDAPALDLSAEEAPDLTGAGAAPEKGLDFRTPGEAATSGLELDASGAALGSGLELGAPGEEATSGLELGAPGEDATSGLELGAPGAAGTIGTDLDSAIEEATADLDLGGGPDDAPSGLALDTPAEAERASVGSGQASERDDTVAFGDADSALEDTDFDDWLDDADVPLARFSDVKVVEAVPLALEETSIRLRVGADKTSRLALSRVDGVAAAILDGLGERPVAVIDLLLNARDTEADVLQLVRLRSDRFDPRKLSPGAEAPMIAFGAIVLGVLHGSGGDPRFEPDAVREGRLDRHESLEAYERTCLDVERIG